MSAPDRAQSPTGGRRGPSISTIVKIAFAVIALGLLAYSLVKQWSSVRSTITAIGVLPLLHSLAWACIGLLLSGLAWRAGLSALGHRLPLAAAARMFFVSQAGKYIPGSVWPILAQMELGKRYGVPRDRAGIAGMMFLVLHLTTGTIVGLATLPLVGELSGSPYANFAWLAIPLLALLVPPILNRLLNLAFKVLRRPPLGASLTWAEVLIPAGWLLIMWFAYAASLLALLGPFTELTVGAFVGSLGSFALAWCAGFLFILAPAGIGVREAILVLVFGPTIGVGSATAVAALLRLVHTAGDLLLALASGALRTPKVPQKQDV